MLKFIKQFTDKEIKYVKVGNKYWQIQEQNKELKDFQHNGIFLGEKKDNKFVPSIELINLIAKISDKKVFVKDKGEWQFLNGKDIVGRSIVKANVNKDLVLIQNMNDENIGYGEVIRPLKEKNSIVINNILDRGNYLRIERNFKKIKEIKDKK